MASAPVVTHRILAAAVKSGPRLKEILKARRKGDSYAVTVNESPARALADASEITGLPRDNFEV